MSYIKVIDNGHVIKIYEMEHAPYIQDFQNRKDDYDALDITFDSDEQRDRNYLHHKKLELLKSLKQGDRTEERKAQTLRDAKNTLKDLAVANFDSNNLFVTLTYEYQQENVSEGDKHFKEFIEALREETEQDINYLAVREFTKKNRLHYHVMMDWDIHWNDKEELKVWERDLAKVWGQGFTDIERMNRHKSKQSRFKDKPIDNVGAYMAKYFEKSMDDERLKGHKTYLSSQGLKRPTVYTQEDAIEFIKANKIRHKKKTFTNHYESEYLGKILFTEINLLRQ